MWRLGLKSYTWMELTLLKEEEEEEEEEEEA
jgi:hypothetical protein